MLGIDEDTNPAYIMFSLKLTNPKFNPNEKSKNPKLVSDCLIVFVDIPFALVEDSLVLQLINVEHILDINTHKINVSLKILHRFV